jgi:hypothetical protein
MSYQPDPVVDVLDRYDPAEAIARRFGGYSRLARALKIETSTVMRWCQSRKVKGTGGVIPMGRWDDVLFAAHQRGITLNRGELAAMPTKRARSEI